MEEIEKMMSDTERYKEEDDRHRDRLQAKNALERYASNMKQTIEDNKLKDKISDDERKSVLDKCNKVISWIDCNQVSLRFILYCRHVFYSSLRISTHGVFCLINFVVRVYDRLIVSITSSHWGIPCTHALLHLLVGGLA